MRGFGFLALAAVAQAAAGCSSCISITPQAYPCVWDAGDPAVQCPSGWRCGLSGRCHQLGVASGYDCQTNSDCESDWRCSVSGTCVNPGTELLSSTQYEGPLAETVYNPQVFSSPPLVFTHGETVVPSGVAQAYISIIDGGTLDLVLLSPADGGPPVRSEAQLGSLGATQLAASSRRIFGLVDGGIVYVAFDGGQTFLPEPDARALRRVESGSFAALLNDAGYLWSGDTPASAQILPFPDGAGQDVLFDLAMVFSKGPAGGAPACVLATSPSGLFFSNYFSSPLQFLVSQDGGADGGPALSRTPVWQLATIDAGPVQFLFPSFDGMGFAWVDAGSVYVGMLDYNGTDPDAGYWTQCDPTQPCCGRLGAAVLGPCAACDPGDLLGEARPIFNSGLPAMQIRCIDPQSGSSRWYHLQLGSKGECVGPSRIFSGSSLYQDQVAFNAAFPQDNAYAGAHGAVWTGQEGREDEGPRFLADRPKFFLELDAGVRSVSYANGFGPNGQYQIVDTGYLTEGQGFSLGNPNFGEPRWAGGVGGRPTWVIMDDLVVVDLEGPTVALPRLTYPSGTPLFGLVLEVADGGSLLIVAMNDSVYSADVTARLADPITAPPGVLGLSLVPLAGNPIGSMSLRPVSDGGGLATGYAVVQDQLFQIDADDPLNWRAKALTVPNGTPISVSVDGLRWRVALTDGTVESLPGLIPLAPSLPEPTPFAYGYSILCGETYARGALDVYRLQHSDAGDGTGQWVGLGLADPILTANGDPGLAEGGLIGMFDHLYVTTAYGGVWRIDATPGCIP